MTIRHSHFQLRLTMEQVLRMNNYTPDGEIEEKVIHGETVMTFSSMEDTLAAINAVAFLLEPPAESEFKELSTLDKAAKSLYESRREEGEPQWGVSSVITNYYRVIAEKRLATKIQCSSTSPEGTERCVLVPGHKGEHQALSSWAR